MIADRRLPIADSPSTGAGVGKAALSEVGKTALSLGERVARDGAFSSRRGSGEGFLPFADGACIGYYAGATGGLVRIGDRHCLAERRVARRSAHENPVLASHQFPAALIDVEDRQVLGIDS